MSPYVVFYLAGCIVTFVVFIAMLTRRQLRQICIWLFIALITAMSWLGLLIFILSLIAVKSGACDNIDNDVE